MRITLIRTFSYLISSSSPGVCSVHVGCCVELKFWGDMSNMMD